MGKAGKAKNKKAAARGRGGKPKPKTAASPAPRSSETPLCIGRDEQTNEECTEKVGKGDVACADHREQWDRRAHAKKGLPKDAALSHHEECNKMGCEEEGEGLACELCPRILHLACDDPGSRMLRHEGSPEDGSEDVFVCSTCVSNAGWFNLIPKEMREPKAAAKGKKTSKEVDDDFDKPFDDDEGGKPETSKKDKSAEARIASLEKMLAEAKAQAAADAASTGKRKAPAATGGGAGSSSSSSSPTTANLHANKKAATLADNVKRAAGLVTRGHGNDYAHKDDGCNDKDCKIDKREGEWHFSLGNRVDGKFHHQQLDLLGPNHCIAYSAEQMPTYLEFVSTHKCGKKEYETPTMIPQETLPLTDHQVVNYVDLQRNAHADVSKANATRDDPTVCVTRLNLIENIENASEEAKTIMLDPESYAGITAREYLAQLLHEAHRGKDIHSDYKKGVPRQQVISAIMLRRTRTLSTPTRPASAAASASLSAQSTPQGKCFNCRAHQTTGDHATKDCTLAWKLPCGTVMPDGKVCTKLHRRTDH